MRGLDTGCASARLSVYPGNVVVCIIASQTKTLTNLRLVLIRMRGPRLDLLRHYLVLYRRGMGNVALSSRPSVDALYELIICLLSASVERVLNERDSKEGSDAPAPVTYLGNSLFSRIGAGNLQTPSFGSEVC